jgi:hypothetical protein
MLAESYQEQPHQSNVSISVMDNNDYLNDIKNEQSQLSNSPDAAPRQINGHPIVSRMNDVVDYDIQGNAITRNPIHAQNLLNIESCSSLGSS